MAPQVVAPASPERSPRPRKRRRVAVGASYAFFKSEAAEDAGPSSCESVEASGSDGEWVPDAASSGGGGSGSDSEGEWDHDGADGGDSKEGVADGELALEAPDAQLAGPTMAHTPELFCAICEREFSLKHALVRHVRRRHKSDERPFECAICQLAFRSEGELGGHGGDHKVVEGVEHKCKGCGKVFATRHERRQHFRKAHVFTCPFRTCGDRFAEQLAWTRHIRRYHKVVKDVTFDCTECRQLFRTRHELEWHQHQQGHDAFVCTQPGCGKKYSKREHLTRHVAAAHSSTSKEKPFQCSLCQARFAYKHGLVRHTNRSHLNQDKPYQCGVCQLAFKKKSLLQAHSYVHTGVLPFECDVCEERFPKRFLLNRHLRSHGGSTPASTQVFVCEVSGCGAVLFSTEERREHMDQEHREDNTAGLQAVEEKAVSAPSAAEDRGRVCSTIDAASSAEVIKETEAKPPVSQPRLVCQVCNHAFGRQSSLRSHLRTHFEAVDERKVFACPVAGCDKTYTRTSNVMAHYNAVHDARKSQRFVCPYASEGCEGRFGRKSILTNHIIKVHEPATAAKEEASTTTRSVRARKSKGVLERVLGAVGESDGRDRADEPSGMPDR